MWIFNGCLAVEVDPTRIEITELSYFSGQMQEFVMRNYFFDTKTGTFLSSHESGETTDKPMPVE